MKNTNAQCAAAILAMLRGQISKREALEIIAGQRELPL